MIQKDEVELKRAQVLKTARSAIRLKHSLAADAEINEVLPEIEDRFNRAVAAGKPFELTPGTVFDEA